MRFRWSILFWRLLYCLSMHQSKHGNIHQKIRETIISNEKRKEVLNILNMIKVYSMLNKTKDE